MMMGVGFTRLGVGTLALVGPNLPLNPEINVAVDIFSDVMGPHPGKRLADHTECVLHCSSSDGILADGKCGRCGSVVQRLAGWGLGRPTPAGTGRFRCQDKTRPSAPNACPGLWSDE
jgi:hypothetical protein